MPKKINILPVDEVKVLVGECTVEELESVLTYVRYLLRLKKQARNGNAVKIRGQV